MKRFNTIEVKLEEYKRLKQTAHEVCTMRSYNK
jgi:hypothetical protein